MREPGPQTVREMRRGQIVAAARAIVASEGLDALTFAALERRLQFTRGVITYHFRNKEEIVHGVFMGAIEDIDAATQARIAAAGDLPSKIHEAVSGMVDGFMGTPDAGQILLSFWGRLSSDQRAHKVNADLFRGYRAFGASLVREGVKSGVFHPSSQPEAIATVMVGAVIGIVTQSMFDPVHVDVHACVAEATSAILARLAV